MKTSKIILFIIAVGCIVAGGLLFVKMLTNSKVETKTTTYHFTETVTDFDFDIDTADVKFLKATDGEVTVESIESNKNYCVVSVSNNTLVITQNEPKWYEQFGIFNVSVKLSIYLPNDIYKTIKIKDSTGDIDVPSCFTFDDIDIEASTGDITLKAIVNNDIKIKVSTGDIRLEGVTCKNINIKSSTGDRYLTNVATTGDITLESSTGKTFFDNVTGENLKSDSDTGKVSLKATIMKGAITINTSTGKVEFDGCDADTLSIKTSTGSVKGTLLTDKQFIARSSSGDIDVPETSGNICRIETSTGNIEIKIKNAD